MIKSILKIVLSGKIADNERGATAVSEDVTPKVSLVDALWEVEALRDVFSCKDLQNLRSTCRGARATLVYANGWKEGFISARTDMFKNHDEPVLETKDYPKLPQETNWCSLYMGFAMSITLGYKTEQKDLSLWSNAEIKAHDDYVRYFVVLRNKINEGDPFHKPLVVKPERLWKYKCDKQQVERQQLLLEQHEVRQRLAARPFVPTWQNNILLRFYRDHFVAILILSGSLLCLNAAFFFHKEILSLFMSLVATTVLCATLIAICFLFSRLL